MIDVVEKTFDIKINYPAIFHAVNPALPDSLVSAHVRSVPIRMLAELCRAGCEFRESIIMKISPGYLFCGL